MPARIGPGEASVPTVSGQVTPTSKKDAKCQEVSENEFGKAIPDFGKRNLLMRFTINAVGPDERENHSPDADEQIDEHFHVCRRQQHQTAVGSGMAGE
jgi:hypothetical protein